MAVRYKDFTNEQMAQMLAQQPMNTAVQTQAQPTVTTQSQPQQKGGLEGFLGGLGQTIGNVGTSLAGLIGGGVAGIADLATGNVAKTITTDELRKLYDETGAKGYLDLINKAANDGRVHYTGDLGYDPNTGEVRGYELANEGKNQDAFKKMLYGTKDDGSTPNYAKAAGQALDAAATVSNFIPGANGGASMAKALGFNALQGAASGFGQAYADTGGDLESALKAAAAGGAAGAATGGLNKGLNGITAKGGKLANFAVNHPFWNTTARGALSGAVGGAVGGGTAAGLNNGDILAGAAQGAGSGLGGGLVAAPVMYGANKLTSKIPGIGGAQAALNEMEQDYQNAKANGQRYYGFGSDNKAETAPGSLRDTSIAGDIIEAPGKIVNGVKGFADKTYTKAINKNAINRLANAIESGADGNVRFARISQELLDDINLTREAQGYAPLTKRQVKAYENTINNHLRNRVEEGMTPRQTAEVAFNALTNENAVSGAINPEKGLGNPVFAQDELGRYNQAIVGRAEDGGTSLKTSIPNATDSQIKRILQNKEDVLNSLEGVASPSSLSENPNARATISSRQANQSIAQDDANVNSKVDPMVEAQKKILSVKSRKQKEAAAKDLINQLGTAGTRTARANNMVDNVVDLMDRGLTTPEQWEIAADSITGRNGKLSKLYTKLMSSAGDIDTWNGINGKSMTESIETIIANNGLSGNEKGIRNEIQGALNRLPSRQDGSLTGTDDAADVMDVVRDLEARARNYRGKDGNNDSTSDPFKRQKAEALESVATILEDKIYDKVGDISPIMTNDVINELRNIQPNNKKWAKYVDEKLATIKTGKQLRAAQKPYVQVSNYLTGVKENFGTYGQRVGDVYGNIAAQALKKVPIVGGLLAEAADSPIANRAYAKVHDIQANRLAKQAENPSKNSFQSATSPADIPQASTTPETLPGTMLPVDRLGNAIGRSEGARAASDTLEGMLANSNTNDALQATQNGLNGAYYTGSDVYGNTTTPSYSTGAGAYNQGNDYLSRIEIGIQNAFNAGDFESVEYLIDMYNSVSKMYQTNEKDMSNPINWSSADKKSLLEAQDWLSKIDDLEAVYNQAGGAKGSGDLLNIGGRVADFTAGINADKEGKNYQSYANSIGMGIIKSLVNMGGTEYDAERYLDYLPKLSDTKEQAAQKLQMLRNAYQTIINNLYAINQI